MTTTQPRRLGPSAQVGGPSRARPGHVYGYDVRDHVTGAVHLNDYVGQARDVARRDKQHRGLIQQRDGQVREQPWSDRIAAGPRVLESDVWTDAELDARERYWIGRCRPRLNCLDNPNPNRIPIYEQRRQRDQRDLARGIAPRDWRRIPAQRTVIPLPPSVWARIGRWLWRRLRRALTP